MKIHGPYLRKDGRKHVCIVHADGRKQTRSYPRLLLEQKLGRPLESWETVDHVDGNFRNDSPENLRVLTLSDNAKRGWVTGKNHGTPWSEETRLKLSSLNSGVGNPKSKLSEEQVKYIRSKSNYYGLVRDLSAELGVARRTIQNIIKGRAYIGV